MKTEHIDRYKKLYEELGLDPSIFDELSSDDKKEQVRTEMVKQFCRSLCSSCDSCGS